MGYACYALRYNEKMYDNAKEGYRADLDKNFPSKMEANAHRYFTWCHPDISLCEHWPHTFNSRDGLPSGFVYTPDFRLTTHGGHYIYVEVCSTTKDYHGPKLAIMKKYRPDIDLRVIDSGVYAEIKKRYAKKIPHWEY